MTSIILSPISQEEVRRGARPMRRRRKRTWMVLLGLYATQLALVTAQFVWPAIDRTVDGKRFVVVRGGPWPWPAVPVLGLLPLPTGMVVVYISDEVTRETTVKGYDLLDDVLARYPFLAE